ncbi:MAG TPA: hypothetical protein VLK85_13325 [Ramlibacter sp.]|nr:hypothetical protein [Ramlibacter sp.]
MRFIPAIAAVVALSACAVTQADKDHGAHHPSGAATPSTGASPARMDAQMKAMRAMHERMVSAKTPEERQALMAEHMKAMRGGMSMMCEMGGSAHGPNMSGSPDMMKRCTEMKDMAMQMMLDREAVRPPGGK